MSKLYAVYTLDETYERFLGQGYLTEQDLQAIEQNFEGQLQSEHFITLTDGDVINTNIIYSIEEIKADEE